MHDDIYYISFMSHAETTLAIIIIIIIISTDSYNTLRFFNIKPTTIMANKNYSTDSMHDVYR